MAEPTIHMYMSSEQLLMYSTGHTSYGYSKSSKGKDDIHHVEFPLWKVKILVDGEYEIKGLGSLW